MMHQFVELPLDSQTAAENRFGFRPVPGGIPIPFARTEGPPPFLMTYDLIAVGTGFASTFFLRTYLAKASADARVLVLERGQRYSHAWQVERGVHTDFVEDRVVNRTPNKPWTYTIAFGGGSNCWFGVTPRMLPSDFRAHTLFGVGRDWPLDYAELEPFYAEAEAIMSISGPSERSPFPRSTPYPQPPHNMTDPDRALQKAYPDQFFVMPTARARRATKNRPPCCATGTCSLCPVNAKFTIENELAELYRDPRVTLRLGARVDRVDIANGMATGVEYESNGRMQLERAGSVALGANAIFNTEILLRSGLTDAPTGSFLNEQASIGVRVYLRGMRSLQGSSSLTGHGYMLHGDDQRRKRAGALIETSNIPRLRAEFGRWREVLDAKFIYENVPDERAQVQLRGNKVETIYPGDSDYTKRSLALAAQDAAKVFAPLPVEDIECSRQNPTEAHIMGTTRMGSDPRDSVVDRHLVHHRVRNLLVLGSGAFPSTAPANPTLTLSALSLWAAHHWSG